MNTKQNINPLILFICEVFTLISPLFILENTLIADPQHLKAFLSAVVAIIGWTIFKLLTPQIHLSLTQKSPLSSMRYWIMILLIAIASLLIISSIQAIHSITGKQAELYLLAGFALEGLSLQWRNTKRYILALCAHAIGKTAIITLLASTISFSPIPLTSPLVFIALSFALFNALFSILTSDSLIPPLSEKVKRAITLAFVLPPTLLSILTYLAVLHPYFLFSFSSLIPLKRFNFALEKDAIGPVSNAAMRAAALFTITFIVVSARLSGQM